MGTKRKVNEFFFYVKRTFKKQMAEKMYKKTVEEKIEEEAMRYVGYFLKVLERIEVEDVKSQMQIFDIMGYINEYELWIPKKWKRLTTQLRWELEKKIWEWYYDMYINGIPIKERIPYRQSRIILSK